MDFITVTTAVVLLSILLTWYALLKYLERRRRKDVEPPKPFSLIGSRGAASERGHEGRRLVTRQLRSNGKYPPAARPSPAPGSQHLVVQGFMPRYGFAVISVLLACAFVTLGNLLFSLPPLIFFAAAVAATLTLGGRTPGLFALVLATLLSDFFFIKPAFVLSLDWQVFRLSLFYLLGGLLSVFISKLLSSSEPAN